MADAVSDRLGLGLPPAHGRHRRVTRRAPMFGHRPVGWGRHAGAVFGAAFVSTTVQALLSLAATAAAMWIVGRGFGPQPLTVVAIGTGLLWIMMFPIVLAELAIFFTATRGVLTLARRNFGAAYVAVGLLLGTAEASVIAALKASATPRDFVFAAITGVLSGFVYWLIAAKDREVVADEKLADTAAAFR